jgi:hypothetical protein
MSIKAVVWAGRHSLHVGRTTSEAPEAFSTVAGSSETMADDRFLSTVGFLLGGVLFGTAFFLLGWGSVVEGQPGPFWTVAFLVSLIAFIGSFVAPLTLVMFLGGRRSGETRQAWTRLAGYASLVLFVFGIGAVGVVFLGPAGIDTGPKMIALLDGVFGFVVGGIAGTLVTERLLWLRG